MEEITILIQRRERCIQESKFWELEIKSFMGQTENRHMASKRSIINGTILMKKTVE